MSMDNDNAAPAEQDPNNSGSAGPGSTIPKSADGVSITSTPDGSNFEPEEDAPADAPAPAPDSGEEKGGRDKQP
jgi:hypothetical protein